MIDVKSPTMSLQLAQIASCSSARKLRRKCGIRVVVRTVLQPRLAENDFTKLKLPSRIAKLKGFKISFQREC